MAESVEGLDFSLQETLKDLSKSGKQIFCGHIALLILCKISKLRFKGAMTNTAIIRSRIISPSCFF